ncbi:malonyl-CoA/methylmalonyl-CoA synthetase [Neolewinella xylanilytica]|uniref:Malonyl-CoA/methylmalonyl-CoA synthetase n=1 Tax=Neolewinella xylanilytica TaxID=1514080 RepID=A0A2S6I893_9BACT|nr:malonyl-CoA/methylmalonyl-CoA synthetase [Neolewinella xylanilytica]
MIERARRYSDRSAISSDNQTYTYAELERKSAEIAADLLEGMDDLEEERVAFLVPPGFLYVAIQWGIWRAGGIAVPLCTKHPLPSLQYVIEDTGARSVLYAPAYQELLRPIFDLPDTDFRPAHQVGSGKVRLPDITPDRRAMILYTSGTTGKPKGVVTTHRNIEAQISSLVTAWEWTPEDRILNVLPLHHVHGIVNALCCALWSGACCEFLPRFGEAATFDRFRSGAITVFMAVPTIYYKLLAYYDGLPEAEQKALSDRLRAFRLMVSGSAALPVSVLERWKAISDHTLLERYGMTEMGMAISNPYRGERRPGHIGQALEGVSVRLVDEENEPVADGEAGEIQVRGANVFLEYWDRPDATADAFTRDGWFRTGDVATLADGAYRILGRHSVDIIKSGGYKISALEIEEVLRQHPAIRDCGVVGLPDEEWGEIIGACLIVDDGQVDLTALEGWLRDRLPAYKLPRKYLFTKELPRNVMGKVTKQELKKQFP